MERQEEGTQSQPQPGGSWLLLKHSQADRPPVTGDTTLHLMQPLQLINVHKDLSSWPARAGNSAGNYTVSWNKKQHTATTRCFLLSHPPRNNRQGDPCTAFQETKQEQAEGTSAVEGPD